jgi:hypothetical protein
LNATVFIFFVADYLPSLMEAPALGYGNTHKEQTKDEGKGSANDNS